MIGVGIGTIMRQQLVVYLKFLLYDSGLIDGVTVDRCQKWGTWRGRNIEIVSGEVSAWQNNICETTTAL